MKLLLLSHVFIRFDEFPPIRRQDSPLFAANRLRSFPAYLSENADLFAINGVKMQRRMVVKKQFDDDSVKSGNF